MEKKYPFLVSVTILDGAHEHDTHAILYAKNKKVAYAWIVKECKDEDHGYFAYGEGQTAAKPHRVVPLDASDVWRLERLGLAYRV